MDSSDAEQVLDVIQSDLPSRPILGDEVPPGYVATASVLPVSASDDCLTLAMVDPLDDFAASAVALRTGRRVERRRISRSLFDRALLACYGLTRPAPADVPSPDAATHEPAPARDAASDAPVVRFIEEMLAQALDAGASDIHLRATRDGAELQLRVDGTLLGHPPPDPRLLAGIVSRLKILANLDISERRLPQDGRFRAEVGGRTLDVRLSTMPHIHGEGAVLRLLSRDLAVSGLGELGFSTPIQLGLQRLFEAKDGLVLVTGPTGSGKSTTLHAALKQLIRPGVNVVTIEDPVEYRVDGAAQIQVDERIGLSFPRVLRSLLRQDPDIILLGEIRDAETAKIAVQAALTGHLVLATLHTNSAPAAVPRLVDMGVEPYLLAAVLRGVLSQRLVPRVCAQCGGGGCARCSGTGRSGRIAIGELLLTDAEVTEALAASLELPGDLHRRVTAAGYRPLRDDALQRVAAGEIDPADLRGVVNDDS